MKVYLVIEGMYLEGYSIKKAFEKKKDARAYMLKGIRKADRNYEPLSKDFYVDSIKDFEQMSCFMYWKVISLPIQKALLTCIGCRKANKTVRLRIDPYKQELFGDGKQYPICNECYQASLDDI